MVSPLQAQTTPADHFARGKKLVEDNCVDCMGGTQQDEEEGIRELETALQGHYESPVDAYKLLADAYANMSTYVEKKSESESQAFRDREYGVYRKLYQIAPDDQQVLMDYARTLTESKEQIPIYTKVLSLNPKNADARFLLGDALLELNQVKEGVEQVKQAVLLEADPEGIRNYVQRLIEALEQHHCPLKDGAAYNREVVRAEEAATQGAGNPQPMVIFKKKFATALQQHICVTPAASSEPR